MNFKLIFKYSWILLLTFLLQNSMFMLKNVQIIVKIANINIVNFVNQIFNLKIIGVYVNIQQIFFIKDIVSNNVLSDILIIIINVNNILKWYIKINFIFMNKIKFLINYWILCFNNSLIFYLNKILGETVDKKKILLLKLILYNYKIYIWNDNFMSKD